jgi:diguanylate cyclase (GGDEF)-like protein/PAS domain S-box-containing protein
LSNNQQQSPTGEPQYTSLPAKITGLVFWGLVILGIIASIVIIQAYEKNLPHQFQTRFSDASFLIEDLISEHPHTNLQAIRPQLTTIMNETEISGLQVTYANDQIKVGNIDASFEKSSEVFSVEKIDPETNIGWIQSGVITIFQPTLEDAVAEIRKNILISMGALFIAFGFILQWLLNKILATPFASMVKTARAFTDGDDNLRFNEQRKDEFGFLSSFINQALDKLTNQQKSLQKALHKQQVTEKELTREKEQAIVTLESIAEAVVRTDANGTITYMNPVAEDLTGIDEDTAKGKLISELLMLQNRQSEDDIHNPVIECIQSGQAIYHQREDIILIKNHEGIDVEYSAAPIRNKENNITGAVMILQDVRHARELTRQLSHQARHDALTGLFNRREFEIHLREAIESAHRQSLRHSLCYIDLDQFKIVNDTCGHIAGDHLLKELTEHLSETVRDSDILARLGGDEFGVLLQNCALSEARHIADKLRESIKQFRFNWEQRIFEVGASIGVVEITNDSLDITQILSAADIACYAAKDGGRNRIHIYQSEDIGLARRRGEMQWHTEIINALKEDRFQLYYQPIIPLNKSADEYIHYEILLRMRSKTGDLVMPDKFLPAAERFNLIGEIDRWVITKLFTTCNQKIGALSSKHENKSQFIISVNLSGDSLSNDSFLDYVKESLSSFSVPPQAICFEITETVAISSLSKAHQFIAELKNLGCRFALDDFGSGMSSFYYLKNLPVDYLKIDGSYVNNLATDPVDRALVDSVNQIGHVLNMKTIAEFVEDEKTMKILAEIGVDYAQGYHIAKPEPLQQAGVVIDRVVNT